MTSSASGQTCALCGGNAQLQESHILPKFAVQMLKAPGGMLRNPTHPNRPIQDGVKKQLLCHDCEQRFSGYERQCAEFVRRCNSDHGPYAYDKVFGFFALSVCWRVLKSELLEGFEQYGLPRAVRAAEEGERVWRQCLMDEELGPVAGDLHAVVLGSEDQPSATLQSQLPPFWNRYLDTAADGTVVSSSDPRTPGSATFAVSYVKLGRLIILGFLKMPRSRRWKGTQIRRTGSLNEGDLAIPDWLVRFMADRAAQVHELMDGLSTRQRSKISDRVMRSDDAGNELRAIRALNRDVIMFGPESVFSDRRQST